jgi:alcohol dehydrogenase (cytochrome c)
VSPLFETTIDGKKHEVISVSGKDGLLRLLDRDSHDQFYEVPITTRENVDALPTVEGVHRCPGLLGGMEWNGPAYDPLWLGAVSDNADWPSVRDRATALKAKVLAPGAATWGLGSSWTSQPRTQR